MCNTCMWSGGGILIVGVLGTSFLSVHGSKIGVSEGYLGKALVGLSVGDTVVTVLGQEYVIFDGK